MGCCDNFDWKKAFIIAFAELIGTFYLMVMGCTSVAIAGSFAGFSFALAYVLVYLMVGYISGCHVNPAVSIGSMIMGFIHWKLCFFYFIAQFAGSFLGYSLPYFMLVNRHSKYAKCTTEVGKSVEIYEALALEFFGGAILMLLVCSANDKRNEKKSNMLKIGFGLAGIFMTFGPLTGGSINTARSFAPAVMNNVWKDHWVYWVGPNVGACFSAIIYRFVFKMKKAKEEE